MLNLSQNRMTGDVPTSFVNLVKLNYPNADYPTTDGLDLDYNQLTVPATYPDLSQPLHVLLAVKDPNWHLRQGFTKTIGPAGGEIISLDGKTEIIIPAGALAEAVTFTFLPQAEPGQSTGALGFGYNSFLLFAENGLGEPVTNFLLPLLITLHYTDADVFALAEDELALYYWEPGSLAWADAATTCPKGAVTRSLAGNTLSTGLCHLTEFALLSTLEWRGYLPSVQR
jgi:hypothetical protein